MGKHIWVLMTDVKRWPHKQIRKFSVVLVPWKRDARMDTWVAPIKIDTKTNQSFHGCWHEKHARRRVLRQQWHFQHGQDTQYPTWPDQSPKAISHWCGDHRFDLWVYYWSRFRNIKGITYTNLQRAIPLLSKENYKWHQENGTYES
jgi:hypothetical protein